MNPEPENQEQTTPPPAENQPVVQAPVVEPTVQPAAPIAQPAPVAASPVTPEQPQPVDAGVVQQPFGPVSQLADAPTAAPAAAPTQIVPGGKGKSPLKLIAWIAGALIVIAGVALAVYFMFFYVSKADYQKAADAYNSLKATTDETSTSSNAPSISGDNSIQADKLDSQADDIIKKYNEMGNLRAVQKDSTVNKAYVDLKETLNEDVTLVHALAKFMRVVGSDSCASVTSSTNMTSCASQLKNIKTDSSAVNEYAQAIAQVFEDYANGKTSGSSALYDVATKFSDSMKKLQDDNTTKSEALKNAINDKLK